MAFMDILPDPIRKIKDSGVQDNSTGNAGPGFVTVKLGSNMPTTMTRTNGGRVVLRGLATHNWDIDITYNQLTRAEFEPVYSFLLSRQGILQPFYVILPQYELPRDPVFSAKVLSSPASIDVVNAVASGATNMIITYTGSGIPKPGDIFTITDQYNTNHVKAYMITRTETSTDYNTVIDAGDANKKRIHFTPPLTYTVPSTATLKFDYPKFRVTPKAEVQEYSLGVNGLYQFNLSLEEALP